MFRHAAMVAFCLTLTACSLQKVAVGRMGDALAQSGTTFASDDDPELVRDALPFALKLMESLLAEDPRHEGLLLATARGFTQYAYAFVQQDADRAEEVDYALAQAHRARAKKLYLRARDYALRALEVPHPGLRARLQADPQVATAQVGKEDVPALYWAAAAWGSAIALGKDDPDLIADVPIVEALIDRALALDESWGEGSIHSFLITYELARAGAGAERFDRARVHFERAVALSRGGLASPFVSYAENVAVAQQDLELFRATLESALAIDPDARPELRLENLVMQDRARWLLDRVDSLFLIPDDEELGSSKAWRPIPPVLALTRSFTFPM